MIFSLRHREVLNSQFVNVINRPISLVLSITLLSAQGIHINPVPAKIPYCNSYPPEVVSRYCDPQFHVGENYSYIYLFNLRPNICKSRCLKNTNFISFRNHDGIDRQIKRIKDSHSEIFIFHSQLPDNSDI